MLKRLPTNTQGRDFVIGDLHGHPARLHALLKRVNFKGAVDRLFSVGDLIDRGPDNMGALRFLQQPWFHAVRGNHEEMMASALLDGEWVDTWAMNGGLWHLKEPLDSLVLWAKRIRTLPLVIVVGDGEKRYNILHADTFMTDKELDEGSYSYSRQQQLLWGRNIITNYQITGVCRMEGLSKTFVGHSALRGVSRVGPFVYLDTGSGFKEGHLSMMDVHSGTIYTEK